MLIATAWLARRGSSSQSRVLPTHSAQLRRLWQHRQNSTVHNKLFSIRRVLHSEVGHSSSRPQGHDGGRRLPGEQLSDDDAFKAVLKINTRQKKRPFIGTGLAALRVERVPSNLAARPLEFFEESTGELEVATGCLEAYIAYQNVYHSTRKATRATYDKDRPGSRAL